MTDRNEIIALCENANKSGRKCELGYDTDGHLVLVKREGQILSLLVFAEIERKQPKWYEIINEPLHVRFVTSNRGKREYYGIFRESHRNVSGTSVAKFSIAERDKAQQYCDRHNAKLKTKTI
jgi:hypothetical protein